MYLVLIQHKTKFGSGFCDTTGGALSHEYWVEVNLAKQGNIAQALTTAYVDIDLAADGAPTDRGILVQSGRMFFGGCSSLVAVAAISSSSSSSCCKNASSHFSRVISTPPVLRALNAKNPTT